MPDTTTVTIADMTTPADAEAFRTLNEAWITQFFALEDEDRRLLEHPHDQVIAPGGVVLVARLSEHSGATDDADADAGDVVIGCVGLARLAPGDHGTNGEDGVYELIKMAVSPDHQGHGTGRLLIATAIDRAREIGARRLVLESNRQLGPAVHLYETMGFRHLEPHEREASPYVRADVAMRLDLR
jgi:putative acetyltransferase